MNLQRLNELLQSRGWADEDHGGWDFFSGMTQAYEEWEIAVCDADNATIHLYHTETNVYWSCDKSGNSNQLLDFAEQTIRDVMRDYHQSPGQLSLELSL